MRHDALFCKGAKLETCWQTRLHVCADSTGWAVHVRWLTGTGCSPGDHTMQTILHFLYQTVQILASLVPPPLAVSCTGCNVGMPGRDDTGNLDAAMLDRDGTELDGWLR